MPLLAACAPPAAEMARVPSFVAAEIETVGGACYGRDIAPAVIETVTVQEQATAPVLGPDGAVAVPATYRSRVRQEIAREREAVAFETLCPPDYTPEFVASLQRALAARGFYAGEADGVMDEGLGRAVQDFQRGWGPDSPLLSLAAARRLGLVALSAEQMAAM